jgi:hypothetical protein
MGDAQQPLAGKPAAAAANVRGEVVLTLTH